MDKMIKLPTVGEILKEEFMDPYGISQYKLAKETGMPVSRIQDILHNRRKVTPDTSLRLGIYFGVSEKYFLNIQMDLDIRELKNSEKESIDKIVLSSEGTTKVILINKIKNVGERGTVKEVPFEQAQKWLEQGLVILATYENIRLFEQEKDENQALLDGYMKTYRDLKEKLEEKPIVVYAKLREDGIIKQSDVVNEIIKYCNKISNVHLDANKIEINKILNAFGTYQVKIMINQDIIADTKVSILDKN